jgi:hypothetical protein
MWGLGTSSVSAVVHPRQGAAVKDHEACSVAQRFRRLNCTTEQASSPSPVRNVESCCHSGDGILPWPVPECNGFSPLLNHISSMFSTMDSHYKWIWPPTTNKPQNVAHSEPAPHQCTTIHWMPINIQLWMNLNWVSIWFYLGNQLCKK